MQRERFEERRPEIVRVRERRLGGAIGCHYGENAIMTTRLVSLVAFLLASPSALAQHVICCGWLYDVKGDWVGASGVVMKKFVLRATSDGAAVMVGRGPLKR